VFLLDGLGETRKNTHHHPRFCLDWNLDTDDFANMGLFINEVSRTVPTTFKLKNTPGQWHWDCGGCEYVFQVSMNRQKAL